MGRRTNSKELRDMVHYLRQEIPDIALRTTLITGFPGESEQDFEQLKEFVEELRFDRLGVFTYSREEDTPAAAMDRTIEKSLKKIQKKEEKLLQKSGGMRSCRSSKRSLLRRRRRRLDVL